MAAYLAMRIMDNKLDYNVITTGYPQFKEDIDLILMADGYEHLIVK